MPVSNAGALQHDVDTPRHAADAARRRVAIKRLAVLCAVLVLAITSLSAFIRLSRAGLSCQPWPQCYGQSLRQLQQGLPATAGEGEATALARLVHRVVASAALLLVMIMLVVCLTARPVLWREGSVAFALLALALFLAVLGRWSSDARLPVVAMGNLIGGFAMLALSCRLALPSPAKAATALRAWATISVALMACQIALGGLVSASYAAASCDGLIDCLSAARDIPWSGLDPWREPVLAAAPPVNAAGALAQAAHRLVGAVVVLLLLPLAVAAWRGGRRGAGLLLGVLVAAEAALGVFMSESDGALVLALAHNIAATLLLATTFDLIRGPEAVPGPVLR